ncbi:MAG: MerR family transcriptional regulator [candidate division KSB1 bacterium]|nr:MerR family transcriptional regulator [candidate division KSB1 bacterium]
MRFSIGEFSRMTSLSIKSLRLYHEKELLVPAEVDKFTGYRYYNEANYERAKAIKILKAFDFTLAEIKDMLDECADESELLPQLENKLHEIDSKIRRYREISSAIQELIHYQRESLMMNNKEFEVEEKELETILIAGYRMKGKYQDVGKGISLLYQKMGRQINGKAMALYYDAEYKEDDADFEVCFPIRKGKDEDGISVRELRGGKCVALIHKGPYEILGDSYKRIFAYIHDKGYWPLLPSREVYIKGPGWIFKGNPKNYLTEIQILVEG